MRWPTISRPSLKRLPRVMGRSLLVTTEILVGYHLFMENVGFLSACSGESMLPTISHSGDWVWVNVLPALSNPPNFQRGDLVIARHPYIASRWLGKRIIGMEGDVVDATLQREGKRGLASAVQTEKFIKVPRGHVWLAGDNLSNSTDSRDYGPVPIALLRGRIEARVWPNFTWFRDPKIWLDARSSAIPKN